MDDIEQRSISPSISAIDEDVDETAPGSVGQIMVHTRDGSVSPSCSDVNRDSPEPSSEQTEPLLSSRSVNDSPHSEAGSSNSPRLMSSSSHNVNNNGNNNERIGSSHSSITNNLDNQTTISGQSTNTSSSQQADPPTSSASNTLRPPVSLAGVPGFGSHMFTSFAER